MDDSDFAQVFCCHWSLAGGPPPFNAFNVQYASLRVSGGWKENGRLVETVFLAQVLKDGCPS